MDAIDDKYNHNDLICAQCGSENINLTPSGQYWYCEDCNSRIVKPKKEELNNE